MYIYYVKLFILLFTLINTITFVYPNGDCLCPNRDNKHDIYNIGLNPKYSTEWWYILINYIEIDSPIVSQEIIWLRHGKTCNKSSVYFYQESILDRNGSLQNHIEFQIKPDNSSQSFFQVNNHSFHYRRNNSYHFTHLGINNNISLTGYGYPQGFFRDGFVRTGKYRCDTSYTLSFSNTDVLTSQGHGGIAYVEHVLTSTDKTQSPYIGWNCHYFHSVIPESDIMSYFACQSKFPDPEKTDPYQRALVIFSDNTTHWTRSFTLQSLHNWTSSTSNITYPIYWKLSIGDLIQHYFIPYYTDGEIDFHHYPINLWDSSVAVFDQHNRLIGIGFNEIFS